MPRPRTKQHYVDNEKFLIVMGEYRDECLKNIDAGEEIKPRLPDDDVESISDDVQTDSRGNADRGPNAHGFSAFGSGVADRQGTVTGIISSARFKWLASDAVGSLHNRIRWALGNLALI